MNRWTITDCEPCHLRAVARNLRAGDAAEVAAYGEGSPMRVIWRSWKSSTICYTMLVDGEVAVIGGVVGSLMDAEGMPWLLTTAAVERVPVSFVRAARAHASEALKVYPMLANYVHAPYARAIWFLKLVGFTVDPPEQIAATGEMFCRFHMEAH
jgi:hypothetical protein